MRGSEHEHIRRGARRNIIDGSLRLLEYDMKLGFDEEEEKNRV